MKKLHHKITAAFQQLGQTIATILGNWINSQSTRARKFGLIIIGLCIGATCMVLIFYSSGNIMFSRQGSPDSITRPFDVFPSDTTNTEAEIIRQYNAMVEFKDLLTALDSLDAHQMTDAPTTDH